MERFNANERHCDQSNSFIPKYSIGEAVDCWVNRSNKCVGKGQDISDQLILEQSECKNNSISL